MNDERLERALQFVGMKCFVKYFWKFVSDLESGDVADELFRKETWTEKSCRSRVSHARRIIKSGRAMDAMRVICKSARVPDRVREQAGQIVGSLR